MSTLDQGPLTDDEINELDQFLLNAEGIDESMDVATLDGMKSRHGKNEIVLNNADSGGKSFFCLYFVRSR
jgi:hypothetical protein